MVCTSRRSVQYDLLDTAGASNPNDATECAGLMSGPLHASVLTLEQDHQSPVAEPASPFRDLAHAHAHLNSSSREASYVGVPTGNPEQPGGTKLGEAEVGLQLILRSSTLCRPGQIPNSSYSADTSSVEPAAASSADDVLRR
jgi:hypothetical protein